MRNIAFCLVCSALLSVLCFGVVQAAVAVVHGNPKSLIYHNAGCKYFNCKACTVVFATAAEARSRGYRACKVCGG